MHIYSYPKLNITVLIRPDGDPDPDSLVEAMRQLLDQSNREAYEMLNDEARERAISAAPGRIFSSRLMAKSLVEIAQENKIFNFKSKT